jgi:hypothetical protein
MQNDFRCGWKLHLHTNEGERIGKFLVTLNVNYKVGKSGQLGKDVTIYCGSKTNAINIAKVLQAKFACILPPIGEVLVDDICIYKNIYGRFDACHKDWHQYGKLGIPMLKDHVQMCLWDKSLSWDTFLPVSHKLLSQQFGEFYTG